MRTKCYRNFRKIKMKQTGPWGWQMGMTRWVGGWMDGWKGGWKNEGTDLTNNHKINNVCK
jgi:hypothetical protein